MPKKPTADSSEQPPKKKRSTTTRKPASRGTKLRDSKPRAAKPASTRPRGTGARVSGASTRKPKIAAPPPVPEPVKPAPPESLQYALTAVDAARSKLAKDMLLLDLRELADFTDYFFICSGTNPRQVQAICDEIDLRMKQLGLRATHTEGYNHAEWVLLDYVDFVAHIFTEAAREYYDLARLWRTADRVPLGEDDALPVAGSSD
mgnify:CR=1 FL=1